MRFRIGEQPLPIREGRVVNKALLDTPFLSPAFSKKLKNIFFFLNIKTGHVTILFRVTNMDFLHFSFKNNQNYTFIQFISPGDEKVFAMYANI